MKIFKNREEAGKLLSYKLKKYQEDDSLVYAIPNGGVLVGKEIAKNLKIPLKLIIVRKIQFPWNTEAGFGACSPSGCLILNEEMIIDFGLSKNEIEEQKRKTQIILKERIKKYKIKEEKSLEGKIVILTDDGLATGYTMIVACREIRKKFPKKLVVAVPCASREAYEKVGEECDEIISLNVKTGYPFAVADFYKNWYDVSDEEVLKFTNLSKWKLE